MFLMHLRRTENTSYAANHYRRQESAGSANRPLRFRNPFDTMRATGARATGGMAKFVNRIARFWRTRLENQGILNRLHEEENGQYPYQEPYHPEAAKQQQAN